MSRSKKGKKAPGYEYWSKRPIAKNHGAAPGRDTKTRTHRLERLEAKKKVKEQLDDDES